MTNNTNPDTQRGGRLGTIGFGAGIAATLVAGIAFATATTNAALQPDESTFVPIEPCRLFDTRPGDFNVGDRNTPLGEGDTHTQQVTGTNGNCTIPGDATAIALNATAVDATAPSFATFYPSGGARPLSSNLNYVPGQAPTPNKIDVKVSPGGAIDIYNAFGNVHLLADVMGYYRDSGLNDLQTQVDDTYTKAEIDAMIADAMIADATTDGYTEAEVDALLAEVASGAYSKAQTDALIGEVDSRLDAVEALDLAAMSAEAAGLIADLEAAIAALPDTADVDALDVRVAAAEALLGPLELIDVDGVPTLRFTGVNLQIVNGAGTTTNANGTGNVIVGYAEDDAGTGVETRTGSHNIVLGRDHTWTAHGGIVSGVGNEITGWDASVIAGSNSTASGSRSAIVSGSDHAASATSSAIVGGLEHINVGVHGVVVGGRGGTASGLHSVAIGGWQALASGTRSVVVGGNFNEASGLTSTVTGGSQNSATGDAAAVSGGRLNTASHTAASVSGGAGNIASGYTSWAGGGSGNEAVDSHSALPGGSSVTCDGGIFAQLCH